MGAASNRGGDAPPPPHIPPKSADSTVVGWHRALWLAGGWTAFGIGVIGVALPGIPTTGPMLLALACFARGSPRLHAWLLAHPVFGPPLARWQRERTMPLRAKVLAVSMMMLSFTYVAWAAPVPPWAVLVIGALIAVGVVVVLRIPHRR